MPEDHPYMPSSLNPPSHPLRLDGHVHLVGDGSSGSGCWLKLNGWLRRLQGMMLMTSAGLPSKLLNGGLDAAFEERLALLSQSSTLDGLLVLAQDEAYQTNGTKIDGFGSFYVPNSHVFAVCRRNPRLFPACSIHPGRPDALDELEMAIEKGCRMLKLLPNCLNVDYADARFKPFWKRMSRVKMALLSHTGGEFTLPETDHGLANPLKLRAPLEEGVVVVAAHAAGRSGLWDPDWTGDLEAMSAVFPNLFCDNSALCSMNRWRTLPSLLGGPLRERVIHGSDYPVPSSGFGPWVGGLLPRASWRSSKQLRNPFSRDAFLKAELGFSPETFTRLDAVTCLTKTWLETA